MRQDLWPSRWCDSSSVSVAVWCVGGRAEFSTIIGVPSSAQNAHPSHLILRSSRGRRLVAEVLGIEDVGGEDVGEAEGVEGLELVELYLLFAWT